MQKEPPLTTGDWTHAAGHDWARDAIDFYGGDWDDGFGYEAVCDNRRALCHTLSGIWCLTYSSPNFPRECYGGNILE